MRLAYSLLLYLAAPVLWLRALWKAESRECVAERFGHAPACAIGVEAWVHAVSVGEAMAALPLIRALVSQFPGRILVTASTETGSARLRELLGSAVCHAYAPYDLPHVVRRFLNRVRPARVVVMETELWPNLFRALRARSIPLLIANGRISPRSFPRYRYLKTGVARMLADCTVIAAQSEADAERFLELGADSARVNVMGNLKFDLELPAGATGRAEQLRRRIGTGRPVWIAASTHEGEEIHALSAHRRVLAEFPQAVLVLVPRHPQRFDAVAKEIQAAGFEFTRRSGLGNWSDSSAPMPAPVLLGDSMGELAAYYATADVAFVGGSLVPVGGHNVLEPAALGLPVLFGPHMFNAEAARVLLLERQAALQLGDSGELATAVVTLFRDAGRRERMGSAARRAVDENRGALRRFLELLRAVAP